MKKLLCVMAALAAAGTMAVQAADEPKPEGRPEGGRGPGMTLDKDGDGKVSVAEMAEGQGEGRLFQRADANGDGALTQDEISGARAAMEEGARGHGGKRRGGDHHGMGGMGGPFWLFDGAAEEPAE